MGLRRAVFVGLAGLTLLVAVVLVRTLRFRSVQRPALPATPLSFDLAAASAHLGAAIAIPTVSSTDPDRMDPAAFLALHELLATSYPGVAAQLSRETVGGLSLLYTWQGTDPSLEPVLLLAHLDVVPVAPDTVSQWQHPPYSGEIADGAVWGRGALDDKPAVIGILEAIEALIAEGWRPERTILLAFGHDEEVGGAQGATALVKLLEERGVRASLVLDEGLVVTDGVVPGLDVPAALIGAAERGYLSLEIHATGEGGHSSMPPAHTAVGVVAEAITRLEAHPMPASLDGLAEDTFEALGPQMPFGQRLAFANLWLTRSVVLRKLAAKASTNATVRTTTAVTMVSGGVKDNVLPSAASAVVNFRIHPRDSQAAVRAHVAEVLSGLDVEVRDLDSELGSEPSPVSPTNDASFFAIADAIREVWPQTVVAPGLMIGMTDARHYRALSEHVYRFAPLVMTGEDLERFHGKNERIPTTNLDRAVRFYAALLRDTAGPGSKAD